MKLKIGSPATGPHFFPRQSLRQRLLRALERDHVAFLGPRRTGKTSLLRDLERNPPDETVALFLDLQGLSSVPAWLNLMVSETKKVVASPSGKFGWLSKLGKGTGELMGRIEEVSVMGHQIKLRPGEPAVESWLPMAEAFQALLKENKIPLIFMLDEFPWFLGHVAKNHTPAEVDAVLNWFRKLRLEMGDQPTRFLVTGSIGLTGLLRRLNLSPAANDLDIISVVPLGEEEALDYLEQVAEGEGVALSKAARQRIYDRLGVGWPILLATFVSEVQELGQTKSPTVKDIDRLYEDQLVRGARNKYCQEMFTRLTKPEVFSVSERRLAQEILRVLSRQDADLGGDDLDALHARLVPDEAHRSLLATELDYVLETLLHDGYLVRRKHKDKNLDGRHGFSSHMLRDYWRHRTP